MSSREAILGAIRANKPASRARPSVPFYDDAFGADLVGPFERAVVAMGGKLIDGGTDPVKELRAAIEGRAVVVSCVPEIEGTRQLSFEAPPPSLADVDVAIVRAAFAVAETGSLALTETELGVNTIAYLTQHLIVLLDPADLVTNLHRAYDRPEFTRANYTVFHTGPSATADIEGILIHGAQGVRALSVLFIPR